MARHAHPADSLQSKYGVCICCCCYVISISNYITGTLQAIHMKIFDAPKMKWNEMILVAVRYGFDSVWIESIIIYGGIPRNTYYAKDFGCKRAKKKRKNKSPIQIHVIGISIVCLCAVPCCGRLNAVLQLCLCVERPLILSRGYYLSDGTYSFSFTKL